MNKTLLLAIIVIVIIVIGVGLYLQLAGQARPEKKILRVGTSPDFPPFEYIDEQGNIVGFDIDVVRKLVRR